MTEQTGFGAVYFDKEIRESYNGLHKPSFKNLISDDANTNLRLVNPDFVNEQQNWDDSLRKDGPDVDTDRKANENQSNGNSEQSDGNSGQSNVNGAMEGNERTTGSGSGINEADKSTGSQDSGTDVNSMKTIDSIWGGTVTGSGGVAGDQVASNGANANNGDANANSGNNANRNNKMQQQSDNDRNGNNGHGNGEPVLSAEQRRLEIIKRLEFKTER